MPEAQKKDWSMKRILITGAAGRLGRVLRKGLAQPDRILRLLDVADLGDAAPNEELRIMDATRIEALHREMDGVDTFLPTFKYYLSLYKEMIDIAFIQLSTYFC